MSRIAFEEVSFVFWGPQPEQFALPVMTVPEIKVGAFAKEESDESDDALGRIVGFEDGLVKILSPRNKANRSGFFFYEKETDDVFVDLFLPVDEVAPSQGYSIETLSGILYKRCPPHTFYNMPRKLFTKDLCPKCWDEKCSEDSIGVGLINYWGSVMPVVMCAEHSRLNRALCEYSPFNKQTNEWKDACKDYFEAKAKMTA